jgi:hypothetical protein
MVNSTALLIIVVLVAAIAVSAWLVMKRRKSAELREHFGEEYDRAVDEYGAPGPAEQALSERSARVEQLHIRPLSPQESSRYAADWRSIQSQFVDDPEAAIAQADRVILEVMQARGYPMSDFDQRAADVSVEHPHVVENYRAAHAIADRTHNGNASTEDMRQAMVHYRALFDALIEAHEPANMEVRR